MYCGVHQEKALKNMRESLLEKSAAAVAAVHCDLRETVSVHLLIISSIEASVGLLHSKINYFLENILKLI